MANALNVASGGVGSAAPFNIPMAGAAASDAGPASMETEATSTTAAAGDAAAAAGQAAGASAGGSAADVATPATVMGAAAAAVVATEKSEAPSTLPAELTAMLEAYGHDSYQVVLNLINSVVDGSTDQVSVSPNPNSTSEWKVTLALKGQAQRYMRANLPSSTQHALTNFHAVARFSAADLTPLAVEV